MAKSSKLYLKALNAYNNGNIEEALNFCEKSIKISMKNAALLNLKGLMLYIKGDLEGAQGIWKMNYRINDDAVSQRYLNDSKGDLKRFDLYIEASKCIKELEINKALGILFECSKSDYNSINVNNYIAVCYIKTGDYENASQYINRVLQTDCKNKMAMQNKKLIEDYNCLSGTKKVNKALISVLAAICVILLISTALIKGKFHYKEISKDKIFSVPKQAPKQAPKVKAAAKTNSSDIIKETKVFPYGEIKKHIDSKNFDKINEDALKWENESLSINEKALLSKGISLLKTEGTEYFYDKGIQLEKKGSYKEAVQVLEKAYNWGKSSYLYQHIIYFIAVSSEKTEDVQNAIKYYEQYDSLFTSGGYEPTVLYNIAVLYDSLNDVKAQNYAHKLIKLYPQCIYNNTKINYIANRRYN